MLIKKPYLIEFDRIGNPAIGYISVAEKSTLPFQVRRVYWTYFTPHDVIRGGHAHRRLNQIIVSLSGTIKLKTETIDGEVKEFILDRPNIGLYIGEMTWREIQFSHNAVLLCIASEEYDEEDYIRNYEDFRKMTASLRSPVRFIEGLKTNLVEVTEVDAADIARLRSNPEINRFLSSQKPISVEDQVEWIRQNRKHGDNFYFKITDKQGAFKGTISLYNIKNHEAEFGRFIATSPINAVESEFLILRFGFEKVGLKRIYCRTIEDNRKVWQMHSRFGFRTVGVQQDEQLNRNIVFQEMTRDEFFSNDIKSILSLIERA